MVLDCTTPSGLYDPEPGSIVDCTYGELFKHKSPVDWIKDWVASPGDQGPGSIPTITETVRRQNFDQVV